MVVAVGPDAEWEENKGRVDVAVETFLNAEEILGLIVLQGHVVRHSTVELFDPGMENFDLGGSRSTGEKIVVLKLPLKGLPIGEGSERVGPVGCFDQGLADFLDVPAHFGSGFGVFDKLVKLVHLIRTHAHRDLDLVLAGQRFAGDQEITEHRNAPTPVDVVFPVRYPDPMCHEVRNQELVVEVELRPGTDGPGQFVGNDVVILGPSLGIPELGFERQQMLDRMDQVDVTRSSTLQNG